MEQVNMAQIINGLKEIKDAIIYKGIADDRYIDLINQLIVASKKIMDQPGKADGISQEDFTPAIFPVEGGKLFVSITNCRIEAHFAPQAEENDPPRSSPKSP